MIQRFIKLSRTHSFFLFGPRGSGKSTLLTEHFKKAQPMWLDLLDQRTEFELNQNPDVLLDKWAHKKQEWIVIDEVQKIPRLLDVVHRGIEQHKICFALTGSSSRKLLRGGANLLGGRASSFFLSPFSALELGKTFDLNRALAFGLLPRFWSTEEYPKVEMVRSLFSYIQTYLKEEVAAEQLVRNLDPFRRLLVCAAQANTKILNFAKLERDAAISHSQAERHFEILNDTLIGRYLPPYDNSVRKRQAKKSKFYFFDTGVIRALTNLAGESLNPGTYEYGELFETFIINEFFKLRDAFEKRWEYSYLRTKDQVEIDLIIEKPRSKPLLIEIKSSKDIKEDHLNPLLRLAKDFPGSEKFILYNGNSSKVTKGIQCLPWQVGLRQIFDI